MRPRSANLSASLFPSTWMWEGTLTHWTLRPGLSNSKSSCSHRDTLGTGPQEPFQPRSFHCLATPVAPGMTYWGVGADGDVNSTENLQRSEGCH